MSKKEIIGFDCPELYMIKNELDDVNVDIVHTYKEFINEVNRANKVPVNLVDTLILYNVFDTKEMDTIVDNLNLGNKYIYVYSDWQRYGKNLKDSLDYLGPSGYSMFAQMLARVLGDPKDVEELCKQYSSILTESYYNYWQSKADLNIDWKTMVTRFLTNKKVSALQQFKTGEYIGKYLVNLNTPDFVLELVAKEANRGIINLSLAGNSIELTIFEPDSVYLFDLAELLSDKDNLCQIDYNRHHLKLFVQDTLYNVKNALQKLF